MDRKAIREDPGMLAALRALMASLGKTLRDDAAATATAQSPLAAQASRATSVAEPD
jgi:hypothetical protein